jgi:hypothetical protein
MSVSSISFSYLERDMPNRLLRRAEPMGALIFPRKGHRSVLGMQKFSTEGAMLSLVATPTTHRSYKSIEE